MSNKEFNVVKTLKLGEVTYRQWYVTLLDALEALDLDDFVKDFKYIRNNGDVAITKEEKGRIAKVKNIIRLSISNEDLESIMECNNPKEMISELDRKYRGPGAKSAWELLRDFDTIKFEGSIQGLFAKLRQLFAAFADKNIKLPSYFINSKVRAILPAEYDEMCKMVDIYNGGRSETDYMSDKQFESELLRFEREKILKFSAQNTSLAATIKSNNSSVLLNKKKFDGNCNYCGVKGHIEKFCRKKMNDSKSGQQNNEAKPSNENKLASLSAVVKISDIDCHMNQLSSNVSSSLSLVSVSSVKFLADCGASNHIVNDRSLLSNIRNTSHQIITMSGVVNGPEQGDMKCQLFNGKSWVPMVIRDVYYVAGQPFNLIAIGKICRRENVRSVTNNDGITIYHKEDPILIGDWSTEYLNLIELRIRIDVSSSKNIVKLRLDTDEKPKCFVQSIGSNVNKTTVNSSGSEPNTVISFVDSRDFHVPDQPVSNHCDPGQPIGAKKQQSEERLQSLSQSPGRSTVDVCVARYEPSTYEKVVNCNESEKWCEAMDKECSRLYVDDALLASFISGRVKDLSWLYLSEIILGGDNPKCLANPDVVLVDGKENSRTTTTTSTGHIVLYGDPIIRKTNLHECVIDNTAKTRFISVSVCLKDVRFIVNLFENLEIRIDKLVINRNNQAVMKQQLDENVSLNLRHIINIKFLMVLDLIQRGRLSIQWMSSEEQLVDVLTKLLSRKNHISFVENLSLYDFVKTGEC
ncbi:uncharacterized protein LOC142597534 [Dermatophagoides farinae]|uniref:uncharacterized protein LOC142597534 n=1 Tax=Dermatophagoides farinae TaxID=6954 RepID=UPI003F644500